MQEVVDSLGVKTEKELSNLGEPKTIEETKYLPLETVKLTDEHFAHKPG